MTPLDWMFVGYSAMWLVIVLYVGNLGRRQAAAERELAVLRAAVDAESEAESAARETEGLQPGADPTTRAAR